MGRRRCRVCREPLPADASRRRRYCSGACAARAYRARKRQAATFAMAIASGRALKGRASPQELALVQAHQCAQCGDTLWPGLRSDAQYCSPACRQRAWRDRHAHDGDPGAPG
ncbi:hypothetical protein AB0C74_38795 [Spirillospora sp. NPDC048832]